MTLQEDSYGGDFLGGFKFKFIAEEELLRIVRKVRRVKRKERDALLWRKYIEEKDKSDNIKPSVCAEIFTLEDTPRKDPFCIIDVNNINDVVESQECGESAKKTEEPPLISNNSTVSHTKSLTSLPPKQPMHTGNHIPFRENKSLQRVSLLRYRISLALDSILEMVQCQPSEPDGPDDLERRRTRLNEFLSRFSRNYLFQLRIQYTWNNIVALKIAELRRQIVCFSLETPGRYTEHQALIQKFVAAHQTAVQSLQAYLSQLPASLHFPHVFAKLQDLLGYLCDLSSLKSQLHTHANILDRNSEVQPKDEIYEKCRELLSLMDEKQTIVEDLSARASSPLSARGSTAICIQQHVRPQGKGAWRRCAAHLARQRFGPPSSIRSGVSPGMSSRGPPSNDGKSQRIDNEMKDLLMHMHDILCNKVCERNHKSKKKKSRHICSQKCFGPCKKAQGTNKPLTEVQNLSSNVQLVITRHQDSDLEEFRDVATDTADLSHPGTCKKNKRVGWVESRISASDLKQAVEGESSSSQPRIKEISSPSTISEQRVKSYRDLFQAYKHQLQDPTLQRWCDEILDSILQDVAKELEPSFLLEKMYNLEFKD